MIRFSIGTAGALLVASLVAAQPPALQAPPPTGSGGGQVQRGGQAAPAPGQAPGGRGAPQAPRNLQVLPKDTPVLPVMQQFTQSLGVTCDYCHVQDRAADDKQTKKTARQMIRLAMEINEKLPAAVSKSADETTRVGCTTCHRGVAIPRALADILVATDNAKGSKDAIQQYWDLRKQYFGAAAYDFSEISLLTVGQRLASDKPDDAIAFLQLNTEFFPQSSRTFQAMSQAHMKKNDKDAAIKDLEKAAALDPQNQGLRRQIDQLKSPSGQ
ncbi:MAG TPA: c-type cytochrome [Vicinamibacterales bacterium]|jgi:tetratricopeptide (TPR) repeat protein|nr:c-type cytochrome [Vicinamibacterales bacterium]